MGVFLQWVCIGVGGWVRALGVRHSRGTRPACLRLPLLLLCVTQAWQASHPSQRAGQGCTACTGLKHRHQPTRYVSSPTHPYAHICILT